MRNFDEWYVEARDGVLRTLVAITRDPDLASDLTSEAFVRAYERWSSVSSHPNPTAWVVRVGVNLHRSRWRSLVRSRRRPPPRPVDVPPPGEPFDPALRARVLALPAQQRAVVALRILADLSTEETARVLRIKPGTVKAHLHRALQALRADAALAAVEHRTEDLP
ncbi:MAG TPA: sigma factor-like helix-turn-helix DNA-binding protein [Egibacteraceae bacterium]|nr:sigma factor-like helix-turn-helix DNA-binding protein [Egibacteraceae bacterium]